MILLDHMNNLHFLPLIKAEPEYIYAPTLQVVGGGRYE